MASFVKPRRWELQLSLAFDRQLSSTLSYALLFSFDRDMRVEKTLIETLASQLSSTLMQLLFSFDQDMRVEKTLIETLASQLSCNSHATLVLVWPGHESWENSHANSRFSTLMQLSCNSCSRLTRTWELRKLSLKLSLLNSHQLSCTLVLVWPGHESSENSHANSRFSTLMQLSCNSCSCLTRTWELRKLSLKLSLLNSHQLSCTLVLVWLGHESWENSHWNSRFSTLMQLSCNSCSCLTRTWELRKLSCKLSLLNSHQLSCNSCSCLTRTWELRKLSLKLSLLNSHQLSCNSCSCLTRTWELRKLSLKLSLLNSRATLMQLLFSFDQDMRVEKTLIETLASQLSCNSHATLVLVWPGHESWENCHWNSRFSTLMQLSCNSCSCLTRTWELRKLSCKLSLLNSHQLSCNSCSCLTRTWELRKLSLKLSLLNSHATLMQLLFSFDQDMRVEKTLMQTLASQLSCNSHATLVLVWPGHESWENSHWNSRFSTLINSHALLFSFDQDMRVQKTLMQTLASQLSCNSHATLVLVWPGHESWENSHWNSRFSTLINSHALLFSFDWDMRVEKTLIETLASQLSCNSHATLVLVWPGHESWENSHANSRFSTLINSHATLVLVWPGHESWENSHWNSRFSTLINSHATLVLVWPGHESWENSHWNSRFSTLVQLSCNSCSRLTRTWELRKLSLKLSLLNSHATLMQLLFLFDQDMRVEKTVIETLASQLSCNSHATLVLVWPGHESWENSHANSRFSTLINSHATLVLVWPGHESWENSHWNSRFSTLMQLSCNSCSCLTRTWELRKLSLKLSLLNSHATLMQLLFLFDQDMRVEKTLMQTLASQLSSTLMQLLFLFDQDMRVEKTLMQTLASQLSSTLMQLLFLFDQDMRVEKTLIETLASQLSCNSHATLVLVWPGHESWENSHANSRFSTLINSHATLVLVWPGHESWENSHANSRFSTLINSHATLVLVWPGHESWENSHANSSLSTLINSHATLVLVLTGHESWKNSRANSRFSTLINSCMQLLFSFDRDMRVEKTVTQTLASQLSSTLVLVWSGHESWENCHANSRFSTLINSHATLVLVWPGHESWKNCHANSRFSTLVNSCSCLTRA